MDNHHMASSSAESAKPRRSGKHLIVFAVLFALTQWPILPLFNVDSIILGLPTIFVYLLVVYTACIGTLIHLAITDSVKA